AVLSGGISHSGGYVDNPCSTPYPPRETVAYGKGEKYGGALCPPSTPGVPPAQAVALCESAEPPRDCRLFGLSTCASLWPRNAGRHHPCPQEFHGSPAGGPPDHARARPDADDCHGCGCLDRGRLPSPARPKYGGNTPPSPAGLLCLPARSGAI